MTGQLQGSKPQPRNLTRTGRQFCFLVPLRPYKLRRVQAFFDAKNQWVGSGTGPAGGLVDAWFSGLQLAEASVQLEFALSQKG